MSITTPPSELTIVTEADAGLAFLDYQGLNRHEDRAYRVDTLATISAGYKSKEGTPVVSRDGTIYVADPENRAPGLAAMLTRNGGRRLTIAMPSNRIQDCISESFRKEGKTRLEAFGDASGITTLGAEGKRTFHPAGSPEFDRLREECKVSTSILFLLADYDQDGKPVVIWPDGMGFYRLRTTSPNTRDNLLSQLRQIAALTGGHVAGFPLEVSIAYRNLAGPKGDKRNCPVFVFALKPPQAITLDSRTFARLAVSAREALSLTPLELPAGGDTIEAAIADFNAPPPSALLTGLNPDQFRRRFFAVCRGTHMEPEARRRQFMHHFTGGETRSLAQFLETATVEDAEALYDAIVAATEDPAVDYTTGEVLGGDVIETTAYVVEEA